MTCCAAGSRGSRPTRWSTSRRHWAAASASISKPPERAPSVALCTDHARSGSWAVRPTKKSAQQKLQAVGKRPRLSDQTDPLPRRTRGVIEVEALVSCAIRSHLNRTARSSLALPRDHQHAGYLRVLTSAGEQVTAESKLLYCGSGSKQSAATMS